MKTLAAALLLVASCASAPARSDAHAAPVAEVWHVVTGGKHVGPALAARPRRTDIRFMYMPGGVLEIKQEYAAVPALSGVAIEVAALREIKRLFKHLPVRVEFVNALPRHAKRVILLENRSKTRGLLGRADSIDAWNRKDTHAVLAYLGELVEAMRLDLARKNKKRPALPAEAPTSSQVGTALGTLIAHEIGHTLGLRHNPVEQRADLPKVMAQGGDKYGLTYLGKAHWAFRDRVYLWAVLTGQKVPDWVLPSKDEEKNGDSSCSCGHPH